MKGEPPYNIDHYVVGLPDDNGYPVYGPLKTGSIAGHWPKTEDLVVYYPDTTDSNPLGAAWLNQSPPIGNHPSDRKDLP